jgi:hypothetical protein
MTNHRSLFQDLRSRTGMFIVRPSHATVAALLLGYDLAHGGGALIGFREWLIVRLGLGNNLSWEALTLHAAFPGAEAPEEALKSDASQKQAVDVLLELADHYAADREKPEGLRRIYAAYERWLRSQDWYRPGSPGWLDDA